MINKLNLIDGQKVIEIAKKVVKLCDDMDVQPIDVIGACALIQNGTIALVYDKQKDDGSMFGAIIGNESFVKSVIKKIKKEGDIQEDISVGAPSEDKGFKPI